MVAFKLNDIRITHIGGNRYHTERMAVVAGAFKTKTGEKRMAWSLLYPLTKSLKSRQEYREQGYTLAQAKSIADEYILEQAKSITDRHTP